MWEGKKMTTSPQMQKLLQDYKVSTEEDLVEAIRAEWSEECGVDFDTLDAELILDGILEATYQRMGSFGYREEQQAEYDARYPEPYDAQA